MRCDPGALNPGIRSRACGCMFLGDVGLLCACCGIRLNCAGGGGAIICRDCLRNLGVSGSRGAYALYPIGKS